MAKHLLSKIGKHMIPKKVMGMPIAEVQRIIDTKAVIRDGKIYTQSGKKIGWYDSENCVGWCDSKGFKELMKEPEPAVVLPEKDDYDSIDDIVENDYDED